MTVPPWGNGFPRPKAAPLHQAIIDALGGSLAAHSPVDEAPFAIDLNPPNPPHLRIYAFSLLNAAGTVRSNEMKVNVRLPGVAPREYGVFDYSHGRLPILLGYAVTLDVFVLWDAQLHPRMLHSRNMQVTISTVHEAAAAGIATQERALEGGQTELVLACTAERLVESLNMRVLTAGGV